MRLLLILLFILLFIVTRSQSVFFEIKAAPELTFPLGKLDEQFWHFPEDSSTVYKNIKSKKYFLVGAFLSTDIRIAFKPNKKAVNFTLESGLTYYYKRYKIDWSANYEVMSTNGIFNSSFQIERHDIGLNVLPGLTYRNINFNLGLNFLFIVNTTTEEQFARNSVTFWDARTNTADAVSSVINVTMPVFISYTIPIMNKVQMQPFVCYDIGIGDMDGYAINWNRREESMLTELLIGIIFNAKIK